MVQENKGVGMAQSVTGLEPNTFVERTEDKDCQVGPPDTLTFEQCPPLDTVRLVFLYRKRLANKRLLHQVLNTLQLAGSILFSCVIPI